MHIGSYKTQTGMAGVAIIAYLKCFFPLERISLLHRVLRSACLAKEVFNIRISLKKSMRPAFAPLLPPVAPVAPPYL